VNEKDPLDSPLFLAVFSDFEMQYHMLYKSLIVGRMIKRMGE